VHGAVGPSRRAGRGDRAARWRRGEDRGQDRGCTARSDRRNGRLGASGVMQACVGGGTAPGRRARRAGQSVRRCGWLAGRPAASGAVLCRRGGADESPRLTGGGASDASASRSVAKATSVSSPRPAAASQRRAVASRRSDAVGGPAARLPRAAGSDGSEAEDGRVANVAKWGIGRGGEGQGTCVREAREGVGRKEGGARRLARRRSASAVPSRAPRRRPPRGASEQRRRGASEQRRRVRAAAGGRPRTGCRPGR
jgi:hypothetical protein